MTCPAALPPPNGKFRGTPDSRPRDWPTSGIGARRHSLAKSERQQPVCSCRSVARLERQQMAGSVNTRASLTAVLCRPGLHIESQLPGAASYLHCRPSAGIGDRRLSGELKIIAAIVEQPVIEKILTHLGLQARARPRPPARGQALQAAWLPRSIAVRATRRPGPSRGDRLRPGYSGARQSDRVVAVDPRPRPGMFVFDGGRRHLADHS